jgi:hypothetical protein
MGRRFGTLARWWAAWIACRRTLIDAVFAPLVDATAGALGSPLELATCLRRFARLVVSSFQSPKRLSSLSLSCCCSASQSALRRALFARAVRGMISNASLDMCDRERNNWQPTQQEDNCFAGIVVGC